MNNETKPKLNNYDKAELILQVFKKSIKELENVTFSNPAEMSYFITLFKTLGITIDEENGKAEYQSGKEEEIVQVVQSIQDFVNKKNAEISGTKATKKQSKEKMTFAKAVFNCRQSIAYKTQTITTNDIKEYFAPTKTESKTSEEKAQLILQVLRDDKLITEMGEIKFTHTADASKFTTLFTELGMTIDEESGKVEYPNDEQKKAEIVQIVQSIQDFVNKKNEKVSNPEATQKESKEKMTFAKAVSNCYQSIAHKKQTITTESIKEYFVANIAESKTNKEQAQLMLQVLRGDKLITESGAKLSTAEASSFVALFTELGMTIDEESEKVEYPNDEKKKKEIVQIVQSIQDFVKKKNAEISGTKANHEKTKGILTFVRAVINCRQSIVRSEKTITIDSINDYCNQVPKKTTSNEPERNAIESEKKSSPYVRTARQRQEIELEEVESEEESSSHGSKKPKRKAYSQGNSWGNSWGNLYKPNEAAVSLFNTQPDTSEYATEIKKILCENSIFSDILNNYEEISKQYTTKCGKVPITKEELERERHKTINSESTGYDVNFCDFVAFAKEIVRPQNNYNTNKQQILTIEEFLNL